MVIHTSSYADFKTVSSSLGGLLSSLSTYHYTDGSFWSAWALRLVDGNAVTVTLATGKPGSFGADFPLAVETSGVLNIS